MLRTQLKDKDTLVLDPGGPHEREVKACRKCGAFSGDDWRQCQGLCPKLDSPHYDEPTAFAFEDIPLPSGEDQG